MQGSCRR